MSAAVHHDTPAAPKQEFFQYTNLGPLLFWLLVSAGIGIAVCVLGVFCFDVKQCLFSWLFAFSFFFTITVGSLFWILLHYAVDAEWSVVVRRILETMANSFSYIWIFFIPLFLGAHKVYGWMNIPPGQDPALDGKRALLEPHFWAVRAVVYFAFFFTTAYLMRWFSTRQDHTGDPGWSTKARGLSFAALPFFGVFVTFAGIDWLMSISYHWYSTMWGVYIFAGSAWSSMATLILITNYLVSNGYLKGVVSTQHFHIMGKLLLSFTVFWAYIAFSQFFLYWYANIPEETEYFLVRNTESWNTLSMLFLVVGHFFVTFALLCPRAAKTNPRRLSWIAAWVLCMHLADIYILVMPFFHEKGFAPHILDLASLVAIGAPLIFLFIQALGRFPLYALRDPRLPESLRLVN